MTARHQVAFIDSSISDQATYDKLSNSAEAHSMTATPKREIAFIDRGVDDLAHIAFRSLGLFWNMSADTALLDF